MKGNSSAYLEGNFHAFPGELTRIKPQHENLKPVSDTLKSEYYAMSRGENGHQVKGWSMYPLMISSKQDLFDFTNQYDYTHTHIFFQIKIVYLKPLLLLDVTTIIQFFLFFLLIKERNIDLLFHLCIHWLILGWNQ